MKAWHLSVALSILALIMSCSAIALTYQTDNYANDTPFSFSGRKTLDPLAFSTISYKLEKTAGIEYVTTFSRLNPLDRGDYVSVTYRAGCDCMGIIYRVWPNGDTFFFDQPDGTPVYAMYKDADQHDKGRLSDDQVRDLLTEAVDALANARNTFGPSIKFL